MKRTKERSHYWQQNIANKKYNQKMYKIQVENNFVEGHERKLLKCSAIINNIFMNGGGVFNTEKISTLFNIHFL